MGWPKGSGRMQQEFPRSVAWFGWTGDPPEEKMVTGSRWCLDRLEELPECRRRYGKARRGARGTRRGTCRPRSDPGPAPAVYHATLHLGGGVHLAA